MKLSDYQKSIKESIAASPQNDEYYLQKLDDIFNNKERFSFNFAAACFGSLWCIYRKMYGLAAITALIKTILLIVIPLAISRPIHGAMVVAVEIAISLFLGFTGNLFYYKFISKKQKEIKPDYYSAVLKKWKLLVYLFIIATTLTLIFGFRFIFVIPMCQAIQQCPQEKLELYFFVMGCICIPTLIMSLWGLVASHSRRFNLNEKTLNDYQKSIRPHVSCNKEALSRNDSYYLWILNKINSGKVISFNFAAFFVGVFWFAYRKMYLEAAILYLISVVFNVTMLIFPDGLILKTCFLIYCIAPIFLANFLYYKYIERKINKPAGNSPVMKKTGIILFLASIFLFALFATYRHGLLGSISALDIIFLSCPHVLMLIIMLILYYRDKRQSTASNAESHH